LTAAGVNAALSEAQETAELTSHDGGHADDARLNPRNDAETAYGVGDATRGLKTGRIRPALYLVANRMAIEQLDTKAHTLLDGINGAGKEGASELPAALRELYKRELEASAAGT